MKTRKHSLLSLVATVGLVLTASATANPAKMNVVFILADDLGWSDTTLYGTTSF
jgi:hypothetical protein